MKNHQVTCPVCGQAKPAREFVPGRLMRPGVAKLVQADHPDWDISQSICQTDHQHYRNLYLEKLLIEDKGELNALDRQVLDSIREGETLAENLNTSHDEGLSFGQRVADRIAAVGGSWDFIIGFGLVLAFWISINIYFLSRPFDPFPFILLNLVLSCLAAIQAPVIMMSQNRQEAKDRLRVEQDYRINLKAEIEIRALHEKLDHLLLQQWERLLEIQQMQMEMMEELAERKGGN